MKADKGVSSELAGLYMESDLSGELQYLVPLSSVWGEGSAWRLWWL